MYKVIGIDEAGRGPVFGSLFVGFSIINLADGLKSLNEFQEKLANDFGVKDSKLLSPKIRNQIFEKLKDAIDMKYAQLTPKLIDKNFFEGGKLNNLEVDAIVQILNAERPNLIIVDALTSKPEKFKEELESKIKFDCKVIAENKADSKYPIVGAASIIAKELREREVLEIKENLKMDVGSGYPSDPKTQEFLKNNFKDEKIDFIFRKSWKTYQNLLDEKDRFDKKDKNQKTLFDY
jgi:ribonuclease HII